MSRTPLAPSVWIGRVLSGLIILFMAFDGITKVIHEPHVMSAMQLMGWPASRVTLVGLLALLCGALYAVPTTAVLGAVLLTGFLGGACATMLRVGDAAHPALFPVAFGALAWLGLFLRDGRLKTFLPFRRP